MKRIRRASRTMPLPGTIITRTLVLLMVMALAACSLPSPLGKGTPSPPSEGESIVSVSPPWAPFPVASPVAQQTQMAWSTVEPVALPTSQATQGPSPSLPPVTSGGEEAPTSAIEALEGPVDLPTGALGALLFPKTGLIAPVFATSWQLISIEGEQLGQWQWAPEGFGYHLGTAWPGSQGNCVLSLGPGAIQGQGQVAELALGDQIQALFGQSRTVYVVVAIERVRATGAPLTERRAHAAYMNPSEDARLTLILCWPDWACTHRQILVAKRL